MSRAAKYSQDKKCSRTSRSVWSAAYSAAFIRGSACSRQRWRRAGTRPSALLKINPLFFDDERAFADVAVDGADVLAEHADEQQLDRGEKEQANDHRGHADAEILPEQQLINEEPNGHQQAEDGACKTDHSRQAQRDFGKAGDAEHGHVDAEILPEQQLINEVPNGHQQAE